MPLSYDDPAPRPEGESRELTILMIWPGNPDASALILFALAMPFLYAGRKVVHDLFRSIGHMIGGPLRLGARWLFATRGI